MTKKKVNKQDSVESMENQASADTQTKEKTLFVVDNDDEISKPDNDNKKYGVKICKSNRYLSWVDDKWYETTSSMTQTFDSRDIDDIFNKLETYCYVYSIDVIDENGNVVDHKGSQILGNPLQPKDKKPRSRSYFSQRGLSMTPEMFKLRNPNKK